MNRQHDVDITPDTKVGALLEQMPELEPVLIGLSPKYKALQNPVLRRTVARVATLRQVAIVGGVMLGDLIRNLRKAAGLPDMVVHGTEESVVPSWVAGSAPVDSLDIRPDVASGKHPLERVMEQLKTLKHGQVLELIAPFVPAPMMDLASKQGYEPHVRENSGELVRVWFYRT